jgi:hypothetical protein
MSVSKTKLIQSSLAALCEMGPKVKTWANLPNDMLYQIGLARIESREKGLIYLPREIEERVNGLLKTQYHDKMQRSISHYNENNISTDNSLYCQYGILGSILLAY